MIDDELSLFAIAKAAAVAKCLHAKTLMVCSFVPQPYACHVCAYRITDVYLLLFACLLGASVLRNVCLCLAPLAAQSVISCVMTEVAQETQDLS